MNFAQPILYIFWLLTPYNKANDSGKQGSYFLRSPETFTRCYVRVTQSFQTCTREERRLLQVHVFCLVHIIFSHKNNSTQYHPPFRSYTTMQLHNDTEHDGKVTLCYHSLMYVKISLKKSQARQHTLQYGIFPLGNSTVMK